MATQRIAEFDTWRPGYGDAVVSIFIANTTTLADIYTDEALTTPASNPQTLASQTIGDITYGKFSVPLYTGESYYTETDSTDQTGIVRAPITTLSGEDAGNAEVTPEGASVPHDLDEHLARVVWAEDHGVINTVSATNTATITAAIGVAAAQGGGVVLLPDNPSIPFNQITISPGVVVEGRGRVGSPTLLQSQVADNVITLGGDGAGLRNLVLDGASKVAGSTAVYSKAKDETVFDNVLIKRFETGLHQIGGRRANWKELYIDDCTNGAKLHGNLDTSGGDEWRDNQWIGGVVSNCTTLGVELSYEDMGVTSNKIAVGFEDNTGTAVKINGARHTDLVGSHFSGNTVNLEVLDDDLTTVTDNTVVGLTLGGGEMSGGSVSLDGLCQDVLFDRMAISDVDFTLTNVLSNIVWRDCIEDALVTLAGNGTRVVRQNTVLGNSPGSSVTTTDGVALKAWEHSLEPGQKAWFEAKIVGVQRNGIDYGFYHISRAAHRPGSTLAYDAQTANFTVGGVLTGATSGATARITADADGGLTGTLTLKDIVGAFIDNEIITDSTGSATANGTLSHQNAALLGSTVVISTAVETVAGYGADFAVAAGNVEVQVTGDTGDTIDWVCHVEVVVA